MAKIALLIGVSEYEPDLNSLPSAVKDVKAIERVLQHPEIGGFAESEIRVLQNPDRQTMEEAIEALFANRQKDDLVLLFFSGHGIKDEQGKLYLANCKTRKNETGELVRSTAVPAAFVQESMKRSRSKRQVVILDCCFSGAFAEGLAAKDDGSIDLRTQLGGEGGAVLTSSTSTQYSFEQQGSDLSVYTRFLVEGIETGAADQDGDGTICIDELHEYAKRRVQEVAPAMKPEIYSIKEGFKILIAKAPIGNPKLKYRKEVETLICRGEISNLHRKGLEARRVKLGLKPEEAAAIEAEVSKPYQERKQSLQQFEHEFMKAVLEEYPLSPATLDGLRYFQRSLGLRNEDVAAIEERIIQQKEAGILLDSEDLLTDSPTKLQSNDAEWLMYLLNHRYQLLLGTIAPFLIGGVGYAAVQTYQQLEKNYTTFQTAKTRSQQGDYATCLQLTESLRNTWINNREVEALWQQCNTDLQTAQKNTVAEQQTQTILAEARKLAEAGQYKLAIEQAKQINSNSPIHPTVQRDINSWAEKILAIAQGYYNRGDIDRALTSAASVPETTSSYSAAQTLYETWQQEWQISEQKLRESQQAIEQGDVRTAVAATAAIAPIYWQAESSSKVPEQDSRYHARMLIQQWNTSLFAKVEEIYQPLKSPDQLSESEKVAQCGQDVISAISDTNTRKKLQQKLNQTLGIWNQDKANYEKAWTAYCSDRWQAALTSIRQIKRSPFHPWASEMNNKIARNENSCQPVAHSSAFVKKSVSASVKEATKTLE